jgi:hypothetical protein
MNSDYTVKIYRYRFKSNRINLLDSFDVAGYINTNIIEDKKLFYAEKDGDYNIKIHSKAVKGGVTTTVNLQREPFKLHDPAFNLGCPESLYLISDRKLYSIDVNEEQEFIGQPVLLTTIPDREFTTHDYDVTTG